MQLWVCVEEGRRWLWVQGSCSSLGHLQCGMLGEDKADGSSPLTAVWETISRLSAPPPLPFLVPSHVSRHKSVGAILRDQNEAVTDNLVWTLHYCCCCCCLSQLGRQILKVCASFLRLWNVHCSAQEVAIQIIYADSCRHHKVSWVQDHMMEMKESGVMGANYHG